MICRRCGNRIPEHLAVRESFKCPECGRQFGTPAPEREPRYADDPYESRSGRYADERYASRDGRYADERYASGGRYASDSRDSRRGRYESGYDDGYYDGGQGYAGDGYYEEDQPYADDGYYYEEDQPYADDGYYYEEDQPYADEDLSDFVGGGRPAGMKLTTVLAVVALGILVLAAVFFIDSAMNPGEAQLSAQALLDGSEYFV